MKCKMKVLGLSYLLLLILFAGFGCELPGTGSSSNDTTKTSGTGGTGGWTGGGTTGGTTGGTNGGLTSGTYTASGGYTYNAGILTINTTTSNFPAGEGPGNETVTITSITSTQMIWQDNTSSDSQDGPPPVWTRSNGSAGDITGTWASNVEDGSIILIINSNGTWSVTLTIANTSTAAGINVSGTWHGQYTDNTSNPPGNLGSGAMQLTFSQTNNFVSGSGINFAVGGTYIITAGKVEGNTLFLSLSETGSDMYGPWTSSIQSNGTISGNTINGYYSATTMQGGLVRTTTGVFTLSR